MTLIETARDTSIDMQLHLRFRSFAEWKAFNCAWYEASGSSIEWHHKVATAFDDVINVFPTSAATTGASRYPSCPK